MKTAPQVVSTVMTETLGRVSIQPPTAPAPSPSSPPAKPKRLLKPCSTAWGRKWLKLDCVNPKVLDLATAAEKFCARWYANKRQCSNLVIVGESGCGKSHVGKAVYWFCHAMAQKALDSRNWGSTKPSCVFISWPEAVAQMKERQFGLFDDAKSHDLVVLDDIGAETDRWGDGVDKLCQILSQRENKFTVITTNIQPAKWTEKFDARISDRLLRNSIVKNLTGVETYARTKARA